jgi:ankyrin repeat protein
MSTHLPQDGKTPLALSCAFGHVEVASMLIDRRAATESQDRVRAAPLPFNDFFISQDGRTPLLLACANGRVMVASMLIDRGAVINHQDKVRSSSGLVVVASLTLPEREYLCTPRLLQSSSSSHLSAPGEMESHSSPRQHSAKAPRDSFRTTE